MKKTKLAMLITTILVSSIFIISCTSNSSNSNEGNNNEANSNSTVESSSNNADTSNTPNSNSFPKTNDSSEESESKKESKNTHDSFYGKWTIKRLIKYGKVSALSEEDVNNLIGKKIEFSSSDIKYNEISYTNPTYSFEEKNNDDLEMYSRVSFKDLNITSDKVTIIDVTKYDNMQELANSDKDLLGFYLIVSKNSSPIIAIDGDYFELSPIS